MDKTKLLKLMAATTSENDNEALAALRAANKMIETGGLTWELLLENYSEKESDKISRMLSELVSHFDSIFQGSGQNMSLGKKLDFVTSLKKYFDKNGNFSQRQNYWFKKYWNEYKTKR